MLPTDLPVCARGALLPPAAGGCCDNGTEACVCEGVSQGGAETGAQGELGVTAGRRRPSVGTGGPAPGRHSGRGGVEASGLCEESLSSPGNLCFLTPAVPSRERGGTPRALRSGLPRPGPAGGRPASWAWATGRHVPTVAALPGSCEVSCLRAAASTLCPSTSPCHNGGVFLAAQNSCSCPPWQDAHG